ncbi:hypothetical protein B0H13DRAFT_2355088 [Mycena leptocephala]|nr:hypothetical protein B0H13DRAFT_2355088 [Mycena leptocephala]
MCVFACLTSPVLSSPLPSDPSWPLPPPNTNRSFPSSPAHNYTFSFLSRLTACPSGSLLRLIYTFVVGVRFICIQIRIELDLWECYGAAQLVRTRHIYECDPGPMLLLPLGDCLARW